MPFIGSRDERRLAVQRALDLIGQPYGLIDYNCESFANEVQYNHRRSEQVEKGLVLAGLALLVGLALRSGD